MRILKTTKIILINFLLTGGTLLVASGASANCAWVNNKECKDITSHTFTIDWFSRDNINCGQHPRNKDGTEKGGETKCCCAAEGAARTYISIVKDDYVPTAAEIATAVAAKAAAAAKTKAATTNEVKPAYVPLTFIPQVQIPVEGSVFNQASTMVGNYNSASGIMTSDLLAKYIKTFYNYGMMIAGILAAIVLMGGGVLWLTSAGNDSKITQAKELIGGSIAGLGILFSSWILLNTINPDLINMKIIKTQIINNKGLQDRVTCKWSCIPSGQTCGGSVTDTIANTSQWQSTDISICEKTVGSQPNSSCSVGSLYDCCCAPNQTIDTNISEEEALKTLACASISKKTGKPKIEGESCNVGSVLGYCKTIASKLECTTCGKIGDLCYHNSENYECANSKGECGSDILNKGDCNAELDIYHLINVDCNTSDGVPCKCK